MSLVKSWRDEEFTKAYRKGLVGLAQSASTLNNQAMCYVEVPPELACNWTVNLLSMRYQSGTLNAGAGTPDQQATPPAQVGVPAAQVSVDFGVGNATETGILIDYPWTGGSFEVTGSQITVRFLANNLLGGPIYPLVGAFLCPSNRSAGANSRGLPSVTTNFVNIFGAGFANVAIPKRAVAYSVRCADNVNAPTASFQLQQTTIPTVFSNSPTVMDLFAGFTSSPMENQSGAFVGNFPINPNCSNIHIFNNSTSAFNLAFRFELDLG